MGMFDYKQYTSQDAANLVITSQKLAAFTNASSVMYIPGAKAFNWLGSISGHLYANPIDVSAPSGWRELSPAELGLPESSKDISGYYTFNSPLTGNSTIPGMGPQAKIFGEFDATGQVTRVCMSWCGSNDVLDVIDYFQLNTGEIVPHMAPLLNALKDYSTAHGLSGKEVIVTGYSLGAGLTNMMAEHRQQLADGFYDDANYIAHEAPIIYDNPDVVLNMGYENDVVYRIIGNEKSILDAIHAGKPGLVNPDKMFDSTLDNIVLFNDVYASPMWSISPFSLLNIPFGWYAHIDGVLSDAVSRIAHSTFYQYTRADSTVIVDSLSAFSRWNTWVEDKRAPTSDHYGTPAFIIGNKHNNLLKGGVGGDYIDAGAGDDTVKLSTGADRVDGGSGTDTIILNGRAEDWHAYRLEDGTLLMQAKDGSGVKQLNQVEKISFEGEWLSHSRPYSIGNDGLIDSRFILFKSANRDLSYGEHIEGSHGNDTLMGKVVFAQGGDDLLSALPGGSLLHGGEGNDVLLGSTGHDELYGAEGNDFIYAGAGNNTVYGGVGNDVFAFDSHSSGTTMIGDFNSYAGDQDRLLFAKALFACTDNVLAAASQQGHDVAIHSSQLTVLVHNTTLDDLQHSGAIGII